MTKKTAITFANEGEAAEINYSIPMPGSHSGKRVMEIELDLSVPKVFKPDAFDQGVSVADAIGATKDDGVIRFVPEIARGFFNNQVNRIENRLKPALGINLDLVSKPEINAYVTKAPVMMKSERDSTVALNETNSSLKTLSYSYEAFEGSLKNEIVSTPIVTWAGAVEFVDRPLFIEPEPKFFIVEQYGLSSFLGDYGMGRTVKTFTLLPGESTTISLKTWQSTKESRKESSSIIDSHEQSARERFANKVQSETTDKATESKTEKWHAEAEVKAGWGWGSAKVSGGGSGEYHSGREQFARQTSEAVSEHASEASSKRELSVSSSSERTNESGSEAVIERTISNVNMRRVLNFVFRELNQTYITKLHLKDIRIGFTNNKLNSWREVPVSGLLPLLKETLKPEQVEKVAQQILRVIGTVYDHNDSAVQVLDQVTHSRSGESSTVMPAVRNSSGDFPPPSNDMYYRFRSGPLAQESEKNSVDGVLLSQKEITMRTDSVIVEALLGQANALDRYEMEIQEATTTKKYLENEREKLILKTLSEIEDPVKRAELSVKLIGKCCSGTKET